MSEGEEYIEDLLKDFNIKFKSQVKVSNLKGDSKSERIADFYLPKYKIYIEFLGMWNKIGEQKDNEYREKRTVYKANKIPCIYLYPENLGILPHILDKKIEKCLEENKMDKELSKYRFFKFRNGAGVNLFFGFVFLLWLILGILFPEPTDDKRILILFGGIVVYHLYKIFKVYNSIYIKKRYTLYKLKNND